MTGLHFLRFAGTVYGLVNLVGNLSGFILPILVGYLTENVGEPTLISFKILI